MVCWGCWGQIAAVAAAVEKVEDLVYILGTLESCLDILTDLEIGKIPSHGFAELYDQELVKVLPKFLQHGFHC